MRLTPHKHARVRFHRAPFPPTRLRLRHLPFVDEGDDEDEFYGTRTRRMRGRRTLLERRRRGRRILPELSDWRGKSNSLLKEVRSNSSRSDGGETYRSVRAEEGLGLGVWFKVPR